MSIPEKPADPGIPWAGILGKVGVFSGLTAAWLFLTGWAYAYNYFYAFGIGISGLNLDNRILPLYGFLTVRAFWMELLSGAVFLSVLGLVLRRTALRISTDIAVVFLTLATVGLFAMGYSLGALNAERVYGEIKTRDYPGFRRVSLIVSADWRETPELESLANDLASGCFRVIYGNGTHLFVFRPVRGLSALDPPVSVIDRKQIKAQTMRRESVSCAM